jgi:hypothetical protein
MNARGVSVFYGATHEHIALCEIRPPVGSRVAVGRFEIVRRLRLLDVEALRSVFVKGSIFDPAYARQLERAKFLRTLSQRISMPVLPNDEAFEYLVTQAMADYLSDRHDLNLDGLIYRSAQTKAEGSNVVLFNKAARTETLRFPDGTKISASLYDYEEDRRSPDYWVWENSPAPGDAGGKHIDDLTSVVPFHAGTQDSNGDMRSISLRLDLDSLKVHHVEAVTFDTEPFSVKRHRTDKQVRG